MYSIYNNRNFMKNNFISKEDEFMKPVILIRKDNSELLTNSNMMLIKGETGSGKSRLVMNMMKGLITGKEDLNLQYQLCPKGKKVIYFSTEMSKYHLQRRLLKVLEGMTKEQEDKLLFYDALLGDIAERNSDLEELFAKYNPHVIIIDQLADLVLDINTSEDCTALVNRLLQLSCKYDCSVIAVVHQNEDSGFRTKARGHLGSTLEQKVVSSIAIKESYQNYTISSTKLREGRPITIKAKFDEQTEMLTEDTGKKDKYDEFLKDIHNEVSGKDFHTKVCDFFECSSKTGYTTINKMLEQLRITKREEGKNTYYNVTSNDK